MAISETDFLTAIKDVLERPLNDEQIGVVTAAPAHDLNVVAGPGSGKTTVMVLRILYLIFVHEYNPQTIMATTFTKKAAGQIRSRLLEWSDRLNGHWMADSAQEDNFEWLNELNFNAITSGTLDSIVQDLLSPILRRLNELPLLAGDSVIINILALRNIWGIRNDDDFITYMSGVFPQAEIDSAYDRVNKVTKLLVNLNERLINDMVDEDAFFADQEHDGAANLQQALEEFRNELAEYGLCSFSQLQQRFLTAVQNGDADEQINHYRAILVDEFQDTNAIQEALYFAIIQRAEMSDDCNIMVVGDDDQSLYRFRGATVEIFLEHEARLAKALHRVTHTHYLFRNYRSTANIVNSCNHFLQLDDTYQEVRPADKPFIHPSNSTRADFPVLGMFRNSRDALAHDLAELLQNITNEGQEIALSLDEKELLVGSNYNQICLLGHSPKEERSDTRRLAGLLSDNLGPEHVFNYRGRNIGEDETISILCGLILHCIDGECVVQDDLPGWMNAEVGIFNGWRHSAMEYIDSLNGISLESLQQYIENWNNRASLNGGRNEDYYLVEIIYELIHWMPDLSNMPETYLRLEVLTRSIESLALITPYQMRIRGRAYRDRTAEENDRGSVNRIFRGLFYPLSKGLFEIDENLLEIPPINAMPILSIHQSKGLEYPMVIVDVGSDFRNEHRMQAFNRFPEITNGYDQAMEDWLRPYSAAFPGWPNGRMIRDRCFDDLIRRTFVAFSRAQACLLLVGQGPGIGQGPHMGIRNIAYAYDRDGNQHQDWWEDIVFI